MTSASFSGLRSTRLRNCLGRGRRILEHCERERPIVGRDRLPLEKPVEVFIFGKKPADEILEPHDCKAYQTESAGATTGARAWDRGVPISTAGSGARCSTKPTTVRSGSPGPATWPSLSRD